MFEGSLVESRGLVVSQTQRWTTLGSLTVQCAVAGLLIAIPLLRPEMLPMVSMAPRLQIPLPQMPRVVPVQTTTAANASAAMSLPAASPVQAASNRLVFQQFGPGNASEPAFNPSLPIGMDNGSGPLNALVASNTSPMVAVVRPARDTKPLNVSRGVSEGLLLTPIRPVYPPIALAARMQGTVVLEAIISKAGRIESLHAVSGPDMLKKAALDAVAPARYRPYLLSGEPTEVQTTITVVFTLGG